MDKCNDLSEFDKGQTLMARRLGQSISRNAALVRCSQSAVVSIYQAQGRERGELVTESWAAKVHWCTWGAKAGPCGPGYRRATVVQFAEEVNASSVERCQNIQCIAAGCVCGCIAADRSGCPC